MTVATPSARAVVQRGIRPGLGHSRGDSPLGRAGIRRGLRGRPPDRSDGGGPGDFRPGERDVEGPLPRHRPGMDDPGRRPPARRRRRVEPPPQARAGGHRQRPDGRRLHAERAAPRRGHDPAARRDDPAHDRRDDPAHDRRDDPSHDRCGLRGLSAHRGLPAQRRRLHLDGLPGPGQHLPLLLRRSERRLQCERPAAVEQPDLPRLHLSHHQRDELYPHRRPAPAAGRDSRRRGSSGRSAWEIRRRAR